MSAKQGKVPEGIVTTKSLETVQVEPETKDIPTADSFINAITSHDPKALPEKPKNAKRYLFDQSFKREL